MASEINYTFKEKNGEILHLDFNGDQKEFKFVCKIDFNSDRKRMSVIMKDLRTGRFYLFCKGADSIMLKKLQEETPLYLLEKVKDDLNTFSTEGLRTLVIAYKELDEEKYLDWSQRYSEAQAEEFNVAGACDHIEKLNQVNLEKYVSLCVFFS